MMFMRVFTPQYTITVYCKRMVISANVDSISVKD